MSLFYKITNMATHNLIIYWPDVGTQKHLCSGASNFIFRFYPCVRRTHDQILAPQFYQYIIKENKINFKLFLPTSIPGYKCKRKQPITKAVITRSGTSE